METTEPTKISITNIIAVLVSGSFAVYGSNIIGAVAKVVKSVMKPKPNPKIMQLKGKIAETRRELHKISQTDEFAKYFKKEREINKMTAELENLEAESPSEIARNLKIDTVVRVVLQGASMMLLHFVSGITAHCIPDAIFWPFNFIIRFPAIFGNDACPAEFAEVSGFAVVFLMLHLVNLFRKNVLPRIRNHKKSH